MTQPKPGAINVATGKATPTEVATNVIPPVGELKDYPAVREQADFTLMRKSGHLSSFRIAYCAECRTECPKQFRFCSQICYEKQRPKEAPHGDED
jgi:hypothetical protein